MFDTLPVIIVTAKTKSAAAEMITEMIDNDATEETRPPGHESSDRVWRLVNKYYTALVRVHARGEDEEPRAHAGPVGAHVALLARDELAPAAAERRLARCCCGAAPAVNVLACDAAAVPEALRALCARRRLEPAALREAAELASREPRGVQAVRAALHAHTWPGLRRTSPGLQGEETLPEERYARALASLGPAAALAAGLQGEERRAAAEQLVAVFAAAIGHPLEDEDEDEDEA